MRAADAITADAALVLPSFVFVATWSSLLKFCKSVLECIVLGAMINALRVILMVLLGEEEEEESDNRQLRKVVFLLQQL
jgi:hypothetical protein